MNKTHNFSVFFQQWEEIRHKFDHHDSKGESLTGLLQQLTGQKSSAPESIWKGRCSSWIPQDHQVSECSRRMLRPCTGQKASCPMSLRKVTCPETRKPFHQMGAQNEPDPKTRCVLYNIYIYMCMYFFIIYLFIYLFNK